MAKVTLPKSLLDLDSKDREEILAVLLQASKLPKTKQLPFRSGSDEHNMWERNVDPLLAEAEDDLYRDLIEAEARNMGELFRALGLPLDGFEKSLEPEYYEWEDELIKAKDSGRSRMSDYIKNMASVAKGKAQAFMKWVQDGKAFTKPQLKEVDKILSTNLPNYAKKAEDYMIRAGFIGKIRGEAEKQGFEVAGAIIDRIPQSITLAEKQDVVLTQRQKAKAEAKGRKVTILPLTPREAEGVKHASHHAGDKMTEISEKHMAGVRQLVIQAKRERWSAQQLASKLFDKFGDHNRDWRRVAITELAFATNDAYLAGVEEGETVVGMGAENACKHCKQYVIGKTFEVTHKPPSEDTYHGDMNQVWAGKSNYGRRVAEYRPAIPMHPNCRCRWHRISRFYKMGNGGKLELKSTAELIQEEREKRGMKPDPNLEAGGKPMTQEELAKKAEEVLRKLGN
jgi:hypothetical protein